MIMKKQLLLFMVLLLPMVANAHSIEVANADGKTIYYVWTNNYTELAVSYRGSSYDYYSNEYSGDVIIPESVTYNGNSYSVTSIGDYAFYYCSSLTSVTIPNSVTSIGSYAFEGCSGLTSVTIPNSVTSIGYEAFYGCSGLTSVEVLCSPTSIGSSVFGGCSNLTDVSFDCETATKLFQGLTTIKSVTLKEGVTSIGNYAFRNCSGLTSVTIPNSVTSIGSEAFCKCSGLTSVTIGNSVTSIGSSAFYNCGLTSVTIPNSVTSIGSSAFSNCSGLTSVTIPNSVTSIGSDAFYACSGLKKVNRIINNIGEWIMNGDLISYANTTSNPLYIANELHLYSDLETEIIELEIQEGITSIHASAFSKCSALTSVSIPNSVTSIGDNAFQSCIGLTSITIPNSVTSIGQYVFSGCSNLESVTIGSGVLTIGSSVFSGHTPAKVIWLTNTPPSGYSNAAGRVNYVANNQYSFYSNYNKTIYSFLSSIFEVGGVRYVPVSPSERTCDAIDCLYNESAENVNIGETVSYKGVQMIVKNVKPYTCYNNSFIKSVQFSLNNAIENYTFFGCNGLTTVTFGDEVTGINDYAFSGCSNLQSIDVPNSVIGIGQYAFQNCSALQIIQIPQSVTSIGNYAFDGCTGIAKVIVDENEGDSNTTLTLGSNGSNPIFASCPLDSVYIGRDITYNTTQNYGYSPFYRNTSLRAVKITDKETEISANEFYGCTNLQRVIIGDGVTTIGNWAFSGCSSLKVFAFGSQVQTIGQEAFSDCTSVVEISSKAQTPPVCGSQALDDINKWNCQLFVPEGCLAAYQAADQWKDFFFAEEGEGTQGEGSGSGGDAETEVCAKPTIHYANGELSFACETDGVTFCYSIAPPPYTESKADKVVLSTKYTVSVYARKDGYLPSEPATQVIDISGNKGLKGDVNEDGVVSITDAVSVVNIILNGGE